MSDFKLHQGRQHSVILGQDGQYAADVVFSNGKARLQTDAIVTVDQLFGRDPQATVYFWLGTITDVATVSIGSTVIFQIAAGPNVTLFPAVNITVTATVTEATAVNPEIAFADLIVATLNANSTFNPLWKASRMKNYSGVFIASKIYNEWGERPNNGDFAVSGTFPTILGYADIKRRGYSTELSRSPNDPRQGVLAISGTVSQLPGSASDIIIENALNAGSPNLRVNGSLATPVIFTISAHATKSKFVQLIRFYGGGSGIGYGKFLSKSGAGGLTNGILIEIKSENIIYTIPIIKTTEDFKNKFSIGSAEDFRIDVQSGADQFISDYETGLSIVLKKQGEYGVGNDDYIKVYIRDNITSGLDQFEALVRGFLKEE